MSYETENRPLTANGLKGRHGNLTASQHVLTVIPVISVGNMRGIVN